MRYCIHRNFSDLTIVAIIATKLKTLLMLNAIYSRSLFLVFMEDKSLQILNAIIQTLLFWTKRYSFITLKYLCIQYYRKT